MNFRAKDLITFEITKATTLTELAEDFRYLIEQYVHMTGVTVKVQTDGPGRVYVERINIGAKAAPPVEVNLTARSIPPHPLCESCNWPLHFDGKLVQEHDAIQRPSVFACCNSSCKRRYVLVIDPDRLNRGKM